MPGRHTVDLLLDRLMSSGVPRPEGARMAPFAGDEDRGNLQALIDVHARAWARFPYASHEGQLGLAQRIAENAATRAGHGGGSQVVQDLLGVTLRIIASEPAFNAFSMGMDIDSLSPIMVSEFTQDISHRIRVITDSETRHIATDAIEGLLTGVLQAIPPNLSASEAGSTTVLTAQLLELVPRPHELMTTVLAHFLANDSLHDSGLYAHLARQLYRNLLEASGVTVDPDRTLQSYPLTRPVTPHDLVREPAFEVAEKYFRHTPLLEMLSASIPFVIPEQVRFEHAHIIAGTGHGKTQTLQHLIVSDLQRPRDQVPAMVVLDSQGDMIDALKKLALFDPTVAGSLADRVLIVDPSDVEFAPALNLFDVQSDRARHYSQRDREQVLAGIIEIYDYIFSGLLGADLSQKQAVVFRFLAQLMLSIPDATIHTLREVLEDANPNMDAVERLPPTARGFFQKQFFSTGYKATREQILRRLYGVLQNPSFERMFANPVNRLDLFDVLNDGGIVLVNTSKDFLKSEASSMFGRYIIALTLKAAFERAALPHQKRRPTFLWIDEASEYFDDNIDNLLIQARKFKLGVVMAHQYLKQLQGNLPASLMTNTSIKLAGGVSAGDARNLAPEMRTTPEFLAEMSKLKDGSQFAAFIRNKTPRAIRLSVPFGTAERMERMSDASFEILQEQSRIRLSSAYRSRPDDQNESADAHTHPQNGADSPDGSHYEPYD